MGKNYRKTGVSLLLAIGITLPAIELAAAPSQIEGFSVKVSYADLNIHSEAGAKVLYSRLKRASQKVCDVGSYSQHGSVLEVRKAKACYHETLSTAVGNIDSDALKNVHSG